jgi:hypothetical protein
MLEYAQKEVVDKYAAAEYLGLSPWTVMRRANEGIIGRRLGKKWRFTMNELRAYANGSLTADSATRGASNEQVQAGNS